MTPEALNPFGDGQVACFESYGNDLTCLGDSGWRTYSETSLPYLNLDRMTVCPDGRIVTGRYEGIGVFDGLNWITYKSSSEKTGDRVACSANGDIWVSHYQGVSHFDGSDWTTYPSEELGSGEDVDLVRDLAIDPDGMVWVATNDSIARFDGVGWQVFEEGQGFDQAYRFMKIIVDNEGRPWVTDNTVLLMYDGTTWEVIDRPSSDYIEGFTIDGFGRVWVGTRSGVSVLDQSQWITYDVKNGSLSTNRVESLAIDERGRVWVATVWGLSVFDGEQWVTYHMHNSGLLDDWNEHILILGMGPDLPEPEEKPTGSISGQIMQDGQPWGNMGVEVCVLNLGAFQYFGDTPCHGQPFLRSTTADADGKFSIPDLPQGRYFLVVQLGDTRWLVWDQPGGSFGRVLVQSGQETVVDVR
ncbi:MAG: hypothetical protein AMJ88_18395 [Anaerolineae bacterium SM23_ 63]|nr:MAG: hypothetical protein AMJ88_18395 [Anaerolineae bacterium SM23_ 63]